ncbi:NAD(P)-dependent glycerol-3-phosphate dehydrogenase [bacterium]|nr:NAD(P)-dependent glycerol-3-phosphate dehydrogenase [bacterium]
MATFCVVGATSWGLTLAWMLHENGHVVSVLTRTPEEAAALEVQRGLARLPALRMPPEISFRAEANLADMDGVVVATPAQWVRRTLSVIGAGSAPVISASKGIEAGTHLRMTEVIAQCWEGPPVAALSGPNLSAEIVAGQPGAAVIAAASQEVAGMWQAALNGPVFRCYTTADVVGVEMAGALKNVIAIAAGVAWGLGYGANTVAALMTRGLAEMTRLGLALGAAPETFRGLAGIGDLAATCFSPLSRNRRFGELLATGLSADAARSSIGEAVEGAATARAALELAQTAHVEMPICAEVVAVIEGRSTVGTAIMALLSREPRAE